MNIIKTLNNINWKKILFIIIFVFIGIILTMILPMKEYDIKAQADLCVIQEFANEYGEAKALILSIFGFGLSFKIVTDIGYEITKIVFNLIKKLIKRINKK